MKASMTLRYVGDENFSRRYLIEKQDGMFWTGRRWSSRLIDARLFHKIGDAHKAYHSLQNRRLRGKPKREFKLDFTLSVRGSARFSEDDLRRYLSQALQVGFDTAAAGDGPGGNFVIMKPLLYTLQEVDSAPVKSRKPG